MKTHAWIWVSAAACAASWGCSSDVESAKPAPSPGQEPPVAAEEPNPAEQPGLTPERPVAESPSSSQWSPCARKVCGAPCTMCDPGDAKCVEPSDRMSCSSTGECIAGAIRCPAPSAPATETPAQPNPETPPATVAPAGYDPCAGKMCGARCSMCRPDDPACSETAELKTCSDDGRCMASPVTCENPWSSTCAQLRDLDAKAKRLWGEQNGFSMDEIEKIISDHCSSPPSFDIQMPSPPAPPR